MILIKWKWNTGDNKCHGRWAWEGTIPRSTPRKQKDWSYLQSHHHRFGDWPHLYYQLWPACVSPRKWQDYLSRATRESSRCGGLEPLGSQSKIDGRLRSTRCIPQIYLYRSRTCNRLGSAGRGRLLGRWTEDQDLVISNKEWESLIRMTTFTKQHGQYDLNSAWGWPYLFVWSFCISFSRQ